VYRSAINCFGVHYRFCHSLYTGDAVNFPAGWPLCSCGYFRHTCIIFYQLRLLIYVSSAAPLHFSTYKTGANLGVSQNSVPLPVPMSLPKRASKFPFLQLGRISSLNGCDGGRSNQSASLSVCMYSMYVCMYVCIGVFLLTKTKTITSN